MHAYFINRPCHARPRSQVSNWLTHVYPKVQFKWPVWISLSLSLSDRRGHLCELTPCRSVQTVPPCHCQAEIKRVQIVLNRSRNEVCLRLPVLHRQSLGGPRMQAWRAREWSWLVSAQRRWPKKDRRHQRIVSDRSGWPVWDRTTLLETKYVQQMWRILMLIGIFAVVFIESGLVLSSIRSSSTSSMHSRPVESFTWYWNTCVEVSCSCSWKEKESSWKTLPGKIAFFIVDCGSGKFVINSALQLLSQYLIDQNYY